MHYRFFPLPLLLLLAGVLAACDSDPGVSRLDVDGVYNIATLTFNPAAQVLPPEDVRARLDTSNTQVTFASGSASYVLNFKFKDAPETYILSGRYTPEGNTRVTVDFGEGRDRRRLLLPASVKFTYDEAARTMSFDGNVSGINLQEYDPDKYGGSGLTSVNGRLNILLVRR